MAVIGHALHFSYSDMLEMKTKDFLFFINEANLFLKSE
jgi:hypothetical protein